MVGILLEVEEVVEGYFWAFAEGDFVAETEDFLVCGGGVLDWWVLGVVRRRMGRRGQYLLCSRRPPW